MEPHHGLITAEGRFNKLGVFVITVLVVILSPLILPGAEASGLSLTFSTYLGGSGEDTIRDIATDSQGNIYLTGGTASSNFPTTARKG